MLHQNKYIVQNTFLQQTFWYLKQTLSLYFYHPRLSSLCQTVVTSCPCQRDRHSRGYGHLPPRDIELIPFQTVSVDLIGPWTIPIHNQAITFFNALTSMDQVSNLFEATRLREKTSAHVAMKFVNTWLARYPHPQHCIHDRGSEFTGFAFQNMLQHHHIHSKPITVRNPQANSLIERAHQTMASQLRSLIHRNTQLNHIHQANDIIDTALASTVFAFRATIHTTLHHTSLHYIASH